jgi:hypothetical protein
VSIIARTFLHIKEFNNLSKDPPSTGEGTPDPRQKVRRANIEGKLKSRGLTNKANPVCARVCLMALKKV